MANIASVALRSGITPSFERGRLEWALVFFESLLRMKSITGSCFLAPPTRCMEVMMKIKGAKHTLHFARNREDRWGVADEVYALLKQMNFDEFIFHRLFSKLPTAKSCRGWLMHRESESRMHSIC
jgi:hypothetical protein